MIKLSQLTLSLCRQFERGPAPSVKTNPKTFWQYCNTKLENKPRLGDLEISEGTFIQGGNEKGDLLNKYFTSVKTQEKSEAN